MIKKLLSFMGFMACAILGLNAAQDSDNIVIQSIETTYKLKADKQGRLESAKIYDREVYKAKDYDDVAVAYTSYGEHVSIDKASAPGAKPKYSQAIGEGVFYEDHRLCIMKVDVKRDKPVTVEFERTAKDPAQICEAIFGNLYDVEDYKLIIEVSSALVGKLTLTPVNFPENAQILEEKKPDGSVRYIYRITDFKKFTDEPMSPSTAFFRPRVRISGYFNDVKDLYSYLSAFVTPEQPTDEIIALAQEITKNATSDIEKVNAITTWVRQNIRYVAIEHGEYGQRPELAANVLANRFGDCKGSANLIKALLRAMGFDGRLVWIGTSDAINTDWESVPTLASGNHMIAACLLDGEYVFLDGTSQYSPAGYISNMIRGQSALVEDGDGFIVKRVPGSSPIADTDSIRAVYTLGADGVLTGDLSHTYSGVFARRYDDIYHSITATKRDKLLHSIAANGKKSISVNDVRFERESTDSPCAFLYASVSDGNAVKRSGDRILVSVPVFDPEYAMTFDAAKRVNPVRIAYPCKYVADIVVNLDEKAYQIDKPADTDIQSPWFAGFVKYSLEGGSLHISAELETKAVDVPREDLPEWNAAVRQLKKALSPVIKCRALPVPES